ncbi:MAG: SigB/SigF/SigG family RNA polymerase sigma factor [Clostridia bacterium]|nr:SigB/SigF/SigG family RNA polymerase sigma factor [Clostridia bacterium]
MRLQDFSGYDLYELIHLAQAGEKKALDCLVEKNIRLVYSVAQRFLHRGTDFDDLVQVGFIGLIKAVNNFNSEFGVQFSTYAVPMIAGEMRRLLRDDGPIKVSRSLKMLAIRAMAVKEQLLAQNGREPTISEIAKTLQVSEAELATAFDVLTPPESLYAVSGENDSLFLIDKISTGSSEEANILNEICIESLIKKLPEREQTIINMRYFNDKTQKEVAERLGISQVQVSRLERKILSELKRKLAQEAT